MRPPDLVKRPVKPKKSDQDRLAEALKTRAQRPDAPAHYTLADVAAVQALCRGEATDYQQKRVVEWLLYCAAGVHEHHFYPSDRETAFSLGRKFVGDQFQKASKIDLALLRRNEDGGSE